jgi:spermidine/putrescine transport system substrate-binding protein
VSESAIRRRGRTVAVALAALVAALVIAACGGDDDTVGGGNAEEPAQTISPGKPSGDLTISNWPGYIDPGPNGTIAEFEKDTGVKVEYIEDVNDNVQFFGKLQPQLEEGESGGRSIFVVTDWMAKQMYDLGYLQEFDIADLPNVDANMLPSLKEAAIDPGRKFSIPWQSGMTGIWVDKAKAPEIRSVNDLFDPKYKGQVTMLTEMRDTVALVMKADGVEPEDATKQDWLDAIDKIKGAVDSGQIRRFTGNDYTEDLTAGNIVAAIGWSGDASIIANKNAEWRMPTEGCVIWSDNMVFPVGAPNPEAALAWADYVYDPKVAADLAAYVTYVTPVDNVQEVLRKKDPATANNELIFPSEEFTADCSTQQDPPGGAQAVQEVTEAFQDVVTG